MSDHPDLDKLAAETAINARMADDTRRAESIVAVALAAARETSQERQQAIDGLRKELAAAKLPTSPPPC